MYIFGKQAQLGHSLLNIHLYLGMKLPELLPKLATKLKDSALVSFMQILLIYKWKF